MKKILNVFLTIVALMMFCNVSLALAADTTAPVISKLTITPKSAKKINDVKVMFRISEKSKVTIKLYSGTPTSKSKPILTPMNSVVKEAGFVTWTWKNSYKSNGKYTIFVDAVDLAGNKAKRGSSTVTVDSVAPTISKLTMTDNPFYTDLNNKREVSYTLKEEAKVSVLVYEVYTENGKEVSRDVGLIDYGHKKPGTHKTYWDGTYGEWWDDTLLPDGTYFIKVTATDAAGNKASVNSKKVKVTNILPPEFTSLEARDYSYGEEYDIYLYGRLNVNVKSTIYLYRKGTTGDTLVNTVTNDYVSRVVSYDWYGKDSNGNLQPGTYYFKVYAENNYGNVEEVSNEFTIPEPAPAPVETPAS